MNTEKYDRFGGWTGLRGRKSGFFHAQKIRGRWWLISPEGNAFFSKGVCCVSFQGDDAPSLGYAPYEKLALAKYGKIERWAPTVVKRLKDWGFNTAGTWSNLRLARYGIAHAPILNLAAESEPGLWLRGGFPDVYSPKFVAGVGRVAARFCDRLSEDPWLIGYFTDNELHWEPDWRSPLGVLEMFLRLPSDSPGRHRAEIFARKRKKSKQLELEFLAMVAGEYFKICKQAIRAHDRRHLILGCRFAGKAPEAVLRAMKPHVDAVSFNSYEHAAPTAALQRFHRLTGKPVMLTEFSFKAADSGLPNSKGGGIPVKTQADRARLFERSVVRLAKMRSCVGYHWFKYCDQPKEGRFDGEDCNYGLVRIDDSPWEVLGETAARVNPTLERVHAGRRRQPASE